MRIPTKIKAFDNAIDGGIPAGFIVLVTGESGTGKSIFCQEVLKNVCNKKNKGLYLSFEQSISQIKEQAKSLKWAIKGKYDIVSKYGSDVSRDFLDEFLAMVKKEKYRFLVIDSLPSLMINAPIFEMVENFKVADILGDNTIISPPIIGDSISRRFIYTFVSRLKKIPGLTVFLVNQTDDEENITRDHVSDFLSDGILLFRKSSIGNEITRSLHIEKMRETRTELIMLDFDITRTGIKILKNEA